MRIALAQLNPIVGDLSGNVARIAAAASQAGDAGAALMVTSELVVSGYPPKDLLLREGFVSACDRAVKTLAERIDSSLGLLVGHPTARGVPPGQMANAVSLLAGGRVQTTIHKYLLPNYDVFGKVADDRIELGQGDPHRQFRMTRSFPTADGTVRIGAPERRR